MTAGASLGLRCALLVATGGIVGASAWGNTTSEISLLLVLLLPVLWAQTRARWQAFALALGYFLAGGRGMPAGAVVFFGESSPAWWGWCLWIVSSTLLATPYAALWTSKPARRAAGFLIAVAITAFPPFGLIGWVSPLASAGALFPSTGWVGLLGLMALIFVLVAGHWRWVAVLLIASMLSHGWASWRDTETTTRSWIGVDTEFSRLASAGGNDAGQRLAALKRIDWLIEYAKTVPPHSVVVLPETILGTFDGIAEFKLQETESLLRERGAQVLVGAELPASGRTYKNALVVLGASPGHDRAAIQGTPVPVSMWKPWADDGAVAAPFGHQNVVTVGEDKVGALICYEQVLAYSFLWLMLSEPDVVVAASNMWWARDTSIPTIQRQMVNSFGRLFGVPVVVAKNS